MSIETKFLPEPLCVPSLFELEQIDRALPHKELKTLAGHQQGPIALLSELRLLQTPTQWVAHISAYLHPSNVVFLQLELSAKPIRNCSVSKSIIAYSQVQYLGEWQKYHLSLTT